MTPDIGLANWFRQRALRSPERKALRFEGHDWTYAEMQQAIEVCAGRLAALDVAKGERVAFLGLNQPMFFFAMFAAARLGAIFVPLNFRLTGPELAFMIEDCAASALIVDAQHRPVIEPQRGRLTSLKTFLAAEDEAHWTNGAAPETAPVRVGEDDVAMILYTSGTTGRPKGAMLTHGNFWWNNANCMHTLDCLADDVTLTAAPVFHIGGLNVTTLVTFQKGGLVLLHRAFDPGRALADIAAHRVTTMFGVPAMFLFMAQHPAFAETDLTSLRLVVVGGAPCSASLAQDLSRPRRPDAAGLRPHRDGADGDVPRARICAEQGRLLRQAADFRRGQDRRFERRDDRGAPRPGGDPGAGAERDAGLLEHARRDGAGDRQRRLVPHRRRRLLRRGRASSPSATASRT